jgi:Alginate export
MLNLISIALYRKLRPIGRLAFAFFLVIPFAARAGEQIDAKTKPPPPLEKKKESNLLSFWDGKIVLDIEERVRLEIRQNNRDFHAGSDNHEITDDAWLLSRFRLGLTIAPNSWVKLFGQTQDSREAFSERPNVPGLNGADGDDHWDLRQAYIAIGDLKTFPLQVTVGRQAITYGDARLVADSRWGNFGRTFDAARVRFEEPHFWVEGFFMRPVQIERNQFNESDSADNFGGAYFSTDGLPFQTSDLYVFYRDKKDNQPDLSPTNTIDPQGSWNGPAARFVTIGTRLKSNPKKLGPWDYSGEFVYENGDLWASDRNSKRFDLSAFALAVSGGYTFKGCLWSPRLGFEYDFASGDDNPNDSESHSFQNLFPSNHDKYGLMDEFGWRNLHDLRFQLSAKPSKKVDLEFHYHAFWLANTDDFWFRNNGISTLRTKTPDGRDVRTIGASNFAGQEIDFIVGVEPIPHVKISTGYSHFFAGQYLSDTGASDDADFGYVMTTFTF